MKPTRQVVIERVSGMWPGLIHFGARPLVIPINKKIKSLTIYLPVEGILHLRRIRFKKVSTAALASGKYTMSSVAPVGKKPADLVEKTTTVFSKSERMPFWKVVFPEPVAVEDVEVFAGVGRHAHRSYGLCVEFEARGTQFLVDTLDFDRLIQLAFQHQAAWQTLVKKFEKLIPDDMQDDMASVTQGLHQFLVEFVSEVKSNAPKGRLRVFRANLVEALYYVVRKVCAASEVAREVKISFLNDVEPLVSSLCLPSSVVEKNTSWVLPDAERGLATLCLATETLNQGHAVLDTLEDYGHFINSPESLVSVESEINQVLSEVGPDKIDLPVVFRAHSLSGSSLHKNKESYLQSMTEIAEVLASLGYESGICYGTFLGAVREQGFMAHDDDVDMVVLLHGRQGLNCRPELELLLQGVSAAGLHGKFREGSDFLKIRSSKGGRTVDVFPISPGEEGVVWMFMQNLKMRPVAESAVLPLGTIDLYGHQFRCPVSADDFLTDRYGSDWRVIQRFVGSRKITICPG